MRSYLFIIVTLLLIVTTSCRKDFDFEPSTGNLTFSKETIYLDTVFTNIGSSTYTLKVYNTSNKNIKIPSVRLTKGEQSNYRLMVDGIPGKVFQNIELLAKDSLFIFIETTLNYSDFKNSESEYLYTDQIEFGSGSTIQKVPLGVNLFKENLIISLRKRIMLFNSQLEIGSYF